MVVSRYAAVKDGVVDNVLLWDGETPYDPGPDIELVKLPDDSPVGPGHTRSGKKFTAPPALDLEE